MSQLESEKKQNLNNFIDAQPTSEITRAQNLHGDNQEQGQPVMCLFFSFDIVNSTSYKITTPYWPIVMESLLGDIKKEVEKRTSLGSSLLWRVIGDEMIFCMEVHKAEQLNASIQAIFSITQKMSLRLRNGSFFERIESQELKEGDIQQLSFQSPLSVKTTAWLAAINTRREKSYDCIKINYLNSTTGHSILDFLGSDVDAGFRLKQYTQERRVAISFELAYLLWGSHKNEEKNLNIIDYVRLKGVWNDAPYPIIWYHNSATMKSVYKQLSMDIRSVKFSESFRYDEFDQNSLLSNYFLREKQTVIDKFTTSLSDGMFEVDIAFHKIILDKNLKDKIGYFNSIITSKMRLTDSIEEPLELHCAVVCCDVKAKKVMIVRRGSDKNSGKGRWEFGCAKAKSSVSLVKTIKEYYKQIYAVNIELVLDENRKEQQPKPFAIYEVTKADNKIKKGIIFAAKVKNKEVYRANTIHDQVKWISSVEVDNRDYEDSIMDFQETLKAIFKEATIWEKEDEK
ncbi:hypothetical protein [Oribacterium sinus]